MNPSIVKAAWTTIAHTALIVSVFVACACQSGPRRVGWARPYPDAIARSGVLDIQVVRDGTRVRMTNTSTRAFGACTVWLNMQWAHPIDRFVVGQTLDLALEDFRNEHSERFRAGGFFAAERPDVIVLAQIETVSAAGERELVDLVTVRGAETE